MSKFTGWKVSEAVKDVSAKVAGQKVAEILTSKLKPIDWSDTKSIDVTGVNVLNEDNIQDDKLALSKPWSTSSFQMSTLA